MVLRSGQARERTVQLGAGAVNTRVARVNDRWPDQRFATHILTLHVHRSPHAHEALLILYLLGLSTEPLKVVLGYDEG